MFSFIVGILALVGLVSLSPPIKIRFSQPQPQDTQFTYWVNGVEYPIAESGVEYQEFAHQSSLFESEEMTELAVRLGLKDD